MTNDEVLGTPIERVEDPRLLTGRGMFIDDVPLDGVCHVAFVRAPVAHARIRDVNIERASEVAGVLGIVLARDIGDLARPLPQMRPDCPTLVTVPTLPHEKVCYVGQPVAMVVAGDRYTAEDAAAEVDVDYEVLPTIVDAEQAVLPEAPQIHADVPGNIAGVLSHVVGDPDSVFSSAPVIVTGRYVLDRSAPMPMETRGIAARMDPAANELTVWDPAQTPHALRTLLATRLQIPKPGVRVIVPDTGGSFGAKGIATPETLLVPWAAIRFHRPVKWVEDRAEHFVATYHERKQVHQVEIAADHDGVVLGLRDSFIHDTGAFTPYGLTVLHNTVGHLPSMYRIPNIAIHARAVYTNTVPVTPYRGAGRPQACFAIERALDRLARELSIDRAELRRRNLVPPDQLPYRRSGLQTLDGYVVELDSGDYPALLERFLDRIGYHTFADEQSEARARGTLLGIGLAPCIESTGLGPVDSANLEVEPYTGLVRIRTGMPSQGQSHETTLTQVACSVLNVKPDRVVMQPIDTASPVEGIGTFASRVAVFGANAVRHAALQIRERLLRVGANMLEASVSDLDLRDGSVVVKGAEQRRLTYGQIAAAVGTEPRHERTAVDAPANPNASPAPGVPFGAVTDEHAGPVFPPGEVPGLVATGYFSPRNATWGAGIHCAVVDIHPESGQLTYRRYVMVHDCGGMLNPNVVRGQIVGGIVQGIGGAFFEQLAYNAEGQLENGSFMDFLIPYATEVPPILVDHIDTPTPLNPLGIKGVGECGVIGVAAATASAIDHALAELGVEVTEMPLNPSALRTLIRDAQARRADPESLVP